MWIVIYCNIILYSYILQQSGFMFQPNLYLFCRFPMTTVSKLSICLNDLGLHHSPLMGHITEILKQRLDSIEDARYYFSLSNKHVTSLSYKKKSNNLYFSKLSQSVNYAHDQCVVAAVCWLTGRADWKSWDSVGRHGRVTIQQSQEGSPIPQTHEVCPSALTGKVQPHSPEKCSQSGCGESQHYNDTVSVTAVQQLGLQTGCHAEADGADGLMHWPRLFYKTFYCTGTPGRASNQREVKAERTAQDI